MAEISTFASSGSRATSGAQGWEQGRPPAASRRAVCALPHCGRLAEYLSRRVTPLASP
ncbi:MAG: hypothetical protein OJF48_004714 [Afipia sp.]|nr:MAG: hypothetical protein OJF48_004714 [Afipia sp.]